MTPEGCRPGSLDLGVRQDAGGSGTGAGLGRPGRGEVASCRCP